MTHAPDQLIDATMARALHADTCRTHAIVAWVVMWDLPAHLERFAARLATNGTASSCRFLQAEIVAEHLQPRCRAVEVAQTSTAGTRHGQHPLAWRDIDGAGLIRVESGRRQPIPPVGMETPNLFAPGLSM
jgi:hypothetical protein